MFIINFTGGIGNQIFQYSLYKSITINYPNTNIVMFDSCHGHNGFELDKVFSLKLESIKAPHFISFLSKHYTFFDRQKTIIKLINVFNKIIYKQKIILQGNPNTYYGEIYKLNLNYSYIFVGYWQNLKYFIKIKEMLKNDLLFKKPLKGKNLEYQKIIEDSNSVSIHIRRGDYALVGFPILSLRYYLEAVRIIEESILNPTYFIFSDDKEYIINNINFLSNYKIVDMNSGDESYIDMQLMSLCKNNIIANSTFSFWGAFLNKNNEKIVISPNKIRPEHNDNFACKEWIQLDIEKYME